MATYRIDGVAQQEIDQIWDYYYGVANEIVANRRIGSLYESFRLLSEIPIWEWRVPNSGRMHEAMWCRELRISSCTTQDPMAWRSRESLTVGKNCRAHFEKTNR